jgi:hypothetical protein
MKFVTMFISGGVVYYFQSRFILYKNHNCSGGEKGMKKTGNITLVLRRTILSLVLILLTSCVPLGAAAQEDKPTCVPAGSGFYNFPPSNTQGKLAKEVTDALFKKYSSNQSIAKHEAFRFLQAEIRRWSYYRDAGDGKAQVRLLVTFITPEIVQAVVLNEILSSPNPPEKSLDSYMVDGFKYIQKRNEFVFMLTFLPTTDAQNGQTFSVPPEYIRLHNTSRFDVQCTHSDDFLNGTQKFSDKNQSGFLFFPLGVNLSGKENDCLRTLDPEWDTSLMLQIDKAQVGTQAGQTVKWAIPFTSLLFTDGSLFRYCWQTNLVRVRY